MNYRGWKNCICLLVIVLFFGSSIPVQGNRKDHNQPIILVSKNKKNGISPNSEEAAKQIRSLNMIVPLPDIQFPTQDYIITLDDSPTNQQSVEKSEFRRLVWSDEFNTGSLPDSSKWGYSLGTGDGGWGNSELQNYTDRSKNVSVQGGLLKIKAFKENFRGSRYTSAKLLSKNKFEFKYGKIEVRAKLPRGVGPWPAIWMLGSNIDKIDWPACGEIDIMEHRGSEPNKIYATLHYPGRSGGNADGGTRVISDATTAFHKYSVEWSEKSICIYVDGQLVHSVPNSSATTFNHNFFLILNLAMGGTFGGAVDPEFTTATMDVDYIRVFQ